jgi:hypothetical protein
MAGERRRLEAASVTAERVRGMKDGVAIIAAGRRAETGDDFNDENIPS